MEDAFIVDAVRSPVGRRKGGLASVHPADLGAHVIRALLERTGVDPAAVDDVIVGCVNQVGAQTGNIARTCWLSAGLPEHVPGVTVDRQCGSSQQAVHFAAQAVRAGTADLVVAGGVEVMSLVPLGGPTRAGEHEGMGRPYDGAGWRARYGDQEISQFRGAELIAQRWGFARADLERYALASHERALAAWDAGLFDDEVVPIGGARAGTPAGSAGSTEVSRDEGPRADTSAEKMAALPPLRQGGRITAATSSQISDGAAALLVASEAAVRRHGLRPLARVRAMAVVGSDPVLMLTGPIPATAAVLSRAGLELADISSFEVNEAFAPVVLAWQRETGAPPERTNPQGGAIALGHPLGATGARLMTTLVHRLRRTGGYGLQVMCEGGGMANATVLARA